MSFANRLEHYFHELTFLRGKTVPETLYYALPHGLLNAVAEGLRPNVKAVIHPKDSGAGIPDMGLFDDHQPADQKPALGVVEVKPVEDNLLALNNALSANYGLVTGRG